MIRVQAPDGTVVEFPDGTPDDVMERAMRETFGGPQQPAAPSAPVASAAPVAAQAAPTEPSWTDTIMSGADYLDDTAAIGLDGARRGISGMLGLPVDLVNAGLGLLGAPVSDTPFGGSASIDTLLGAPATAARAVTGRPELQPRDMTQRIAGRVGQELGATAVPLGLSLGVAARVGAEGARQMGPLGRYFVEPAAVAPGALVGKETAYAVGSGLGAGAANEAVGNPQQGDNFWSDFLGSIAGASVVGLGSRVVGAGRNAVGALTGNPQMMDEVAGQEIADRMINNSSRLAEMYDQTGRVDTAPLARQLRTASPVEDAVPGYVANVGDRAQDPMLMTMVQNQDMRTPGAANVRRTGNEAAINDRMAAVGPNGDPAQFRASLAANRDAQIAEALAAEEQARAIFGEAQQAVQPGMPDATARGSSLRSGLQDAYDAASARVSEAFRPINESTATVPIDDLAERFGRTTADLPLNDRSRFVPAEAGVPARLAPPEADGPVNTGLIDQYGTPITREPVQPNPNVPLNEVTSVRSGLSDDIRNARATGQRQAARVGSQYRDQVDEFIDAALPPELRQQYDTARGMRRDVADRFERPGTGIAETLRPREGGGYALDDSAVPGKFAQPDQGRITDTRALLREAGNDPRVRGALADEIMSDVQQRGLLANPQQLERYMQDRSILLGEFPELRQRLNRARSAGEYRAGVEQASAATQKRLNTPGRSAQASYLKYGDEATVDAVRNLTSGPQPREATKELLAAAGDSPEARQNAKAALWEVVKTKKFKAPDALGQERWDAKKLKAMFDDPKTAAVAEELWSDAPEDLASIKELFGALAGAEGSIRTRAPNSSGTAQALSGKFDPALTSASLASRARSVSRGVLSPGIAAVDVVATWLRRRSAQVQSRAIDEMASAAFNNPGLAADLLDQFNPADYAAKRRMLTQKYGVRANQVINLLDEAQDEDETRDAVMEGSGG